MNEEQLSTCFCSDAEELNSSTKEQDLSTNTLDTIGRWTTPMVKLLIKLYVDNKNNNSNIFGKRIWTNVAVSMQEKGYPVNPHQCSEKWRNLKKTYIKIRDTIGKTSSRRNKWEFYSRMEEALGEKYNNSPASPVENSNTCEEITDNNSTDRSVMVASAQTINIPLELCKFEVYDHDDSSPPPVSPSDRSPTVPEESSHHKNSESNSSPENSSKRKSPPLEWYDKYLEELRAARYDRNKRHQDKQIFRQQLLDLCKQMLISSSNNSKEKSS
ncbi:uncharacterized protein [Halyomorpha halys]|uniref:uncharacterized protein n=1 Tax=Halyomorpha halys TaxID=286706 RepID=UPI0034D37D2D